MHIHFNSSQKAKGKPKAEILSKTVCPRVGRKKQNEHKRHISSVLKVVNDMKTLSSLA